MDKREKIKIGGGGTYCRICKTEFCKDLNRHIYDNVSRLEVISKDGREFVQWDCKIEPSFQDSGRTLKIFIDKGKASSGMIDLDKDFKQKSKDDYWKCICGSYHKGFPYKCQIKEEKQKIRDALNDVYNNHKGDDQTFYLIMEIKKKLRL